MSEHDKGHAELLDQLYQLFQSRKTADPSSSYVAQLHHKGLDTILKKIAEEAGETIIAAKNEDPSALVYELADLWFHCLVLMANRNLEPRVLLDELARRMGRSGLDEKASRKTS